MKAARLALALGAMSAVMLTGTLASRSTAAGIPVFDVANYAQNLLQAARALDQINNQVKSLQNETAMLRNMAQNLKSIDFPQLQQMTTAMQRIDQLIAEAQGIDFKVRGLDERVSAIFPGELQRALSKDERARRAHAQLDAATAAYRQAMDVQAQIAENVEQDAGLLKELAASSQGAAGALEVTQASNQLMALSIKQQLQLQNLMDSEFREAAIERARRVQAEDDGRFATRRFLEGPATTSN